MNERVLDRRVRGREQMVAPAADLIEQSSPVEELFGLRLQAGHEHEDALALEAVDDRAQSAGPRDIHHGNPPHSQDDDLHISVDLQELIEEPVRRPEEHRTVDSIGDDVIREQMLLLVLRRVTCDVRRVTGGLACASNA